jgi:hypothetical protein
MNDFIKKSYPYILTILLFFVLSSIYFPKTFQNKEVEQHDRKTWQGMSKEVKDFKDNTGETSFWTNAMFSGMPTYLINNNPSSNYVKYFNNIFQLWQKVRPISFVFLYFLIC